MTKPKESAFAYVAVEGTNGVEIGRRGEERGVAGKAAGLGVCNGVGVCNGESVGVSSNRGKAKIFATPLRTFSLKPGLAGFSSWRTGTFKATRHRTLTDGKRNQVGGNYR